MKTLSKQKLSKMHAMLDKQLQKGNDISNPSIFEQKTKQKTDFSHLRYTSDMILNSEPSSQQTQQKQKKQSLQRSSLFRKSLQKSNRQRQNLFKNKKNYGDISSQQSQISQKQMRNSLKGSRKNEINQLEKKLLDLQKKMENIGLSSSDEDNQMLQKQSISKNVRLTQSLQTKNYKNSKTNGFKQQISQNSLNDKKKSFGALDLKQNIFSTQNHDKQPSSSRNEGTARFSGSNKIQQINKRQKIGFKSNLPLSHRNKSKYQESQSNSEEQFQSKYQKFVKVSRGSQKNLEKPTKLNEIKLSSEQEDSSDQFQRNKLHNKSITQQIQRLSITKKESLSLASNKAKQSQHQNNINMQRSRQKIPKAKINTLQNLPDRKLTVEHQILEPKYSLEKRNKSKSHSKKSTGVLKRNLSKQKVLSSKNSKADLKQKSATKMKIQRNLTNLDNSFRSQNSAKSKKSVNSLRSVGSNKSFNRNDQNNMKKLETVEQKKYIKKIMNLQKQVQHYKRLSKKYQSELSNYKLMQIQYKKLQIQFKKSEQIRIEQKKIIENFRNKTLNV